MCIHRVCKITYMFSAAVSYIHVHVKSLISCIAWFFFICIFYRFRNFILNSAKLYALSVNERNKSDGVFFYWRVDILHFH